MTPSLTSAVDRAMPGWADLDLIEQAYERARQLTQQTCVHHYVAHIVPLLHPYVCGLHVPDNLVVVTVAQLARMTAWTLDQAEYDA